MPDSVIAKYKAAKTDKEKGNCLITYFKKQSLTDAKTKADILLLEKNKAIRLANAKKTI